MKLAEWRRQQGLTQQQLADQLRCVVTTVARYESGARRPEEETVIEIYLLTAGAVQPNDFYDLPALEQDRRDAA